MAPDVLTGRDLYTLLTGHTTRVTGLGYHGPSKEVHVKESGTEGTLPSTGLRHLTPENGTEGDV